MRTPDVRLAPNDVRDQFLTRMNLDPGGARPPTPSELSALLWQRPAHASRDRPLVTATETGFPWDSDVPDYDAWHTVGLVSSPIADTR